MKRSGIYITNNFIRLTQAIKDRVFKEYQLDISSLRKEEIPGHLKKFLKEKKIAIEHLSLGISRSQVSARFLNLPSVDNREIRKMVEYELNNLFPYKQEELVFNQAVIESRADGYSQVMIIAIQREVILSELSLLKQAGLVPDKIELSSVSLFNQFSQQKKAMAGYLLINLEDNLLDIMVVQNQKLSFSRGVNLEQGQVNQGLIKQAKQVIDIQATKGITIDRIIASGRGLDSDALIQDLEQALSVKVEIEQATCVSRGLSFSPKLKTLSIDLLPDESKVQKTKTSRRRSVLYLITLLLLNASLIANIGFLKIRERKEYLYLLKSEIRKIESDALILEKNLYKVGILESYFNSGRLALGLLTEIYRIAPAGIYITSLDISGQSPSGAIVLTGQARDADTALNFATLIKDSTLIKQADVNYIKKRRFLSREVIDFEIHSSF